MQLQRRSKVTYPKERKTAAAEETTISHWFQHIRVHFLLSWDEEAKEEATKNLSG